MMLLAYVDTRTCYVHETELNIHHFDEDEARH